MGFCLEDIPADECFSDPLAQAPGDFGYPEELHGAEEDELRLL